MRRKKKEGNRDRFLAALAALSLLAGTAVPASADTKSADGLHIVTTIFPEYDWVRSILGDHLEETELTMLLDNGVDLHSYQPTTVDMMKILTCDLFIYVGGESDAWVDDALRTAKNEDMVVIDLLDVLGDAVKEEELVEGMEAEEEEEDAESADEEECEFDEHVWLSLQNAEVLCTAIEEAIASLDPDNAEDYRENLDRYLEALCDLDAAYAEAVKEAPVQTLLFGDRFPFRYLVDDYGLAYYAAFAGCSAETEASFETVVFLAKKVDELGLSCVMAIEGSDHRLAQTIADSTKAKDQQILALNSMQSTTSVDVAEGATYLSIMEDNLQVLKEALQ